MPKRKFESLENGSQATNEPIAKNSLDSDEEDEDVEEKNYNVMNEDDFEGVEEVSIGPETTSGFTAFNMKEEMEEGHFDKEGHYLWKTEKEIRDNWLDNIDWVQIPGTSRTLGSPDFGSEGHSSDDDDKDIGFDPTPMYKEIMQILQPGETVARALCRLGKGKKRLTNAERWKRKKNPETAKEDDEKSAQIIKLTELADEILTRTGNMDIYQESYEKIKNRIDIASKQSYPSKQEAELDMYADDFDEKEKVKLGDKAPLVDESGPSTETNDQNDNGENVMWELKWSQDEKAESHGPHTSEQMQAWAKNGYFKKGAWVRKTGQGSFYNASRIDFELYI